jgi:hypothetical protein
LSSRLKEVNNINKLLGVQLEGFNSIRDLYKDDGDFFNVWRLARKVITNVYASI